VSLRQVKLRTFLTTRRSPSIVAVAVRATSGAQFRSFVAVIVVHHARKSANEAA
jgi:hypothetical protein